MEQPLSCQGAELGVALAQSEGGDLDSIISPRTARGRKSFTVNVVLWNNAWINTNPPTRLGLPESQPHVSTNTVLFILRRSYINS